GLLLGAREESGIDRLVRVLAHPLRGESIKKLTDGRWLCREHRGANEYGGCEREAFHEDSPGRPDGRPLLLETADLKVRTTEGPDLAPPRWQRRLTPSRNL